MAILDALTSLETVTLAALFAAALALSAWSARQGAKAAASRATGEVVWSIVAVAMLVVVSIAVGLGGHGGS